MDANNTASNQTGQLTIKYPSGVEVKLGNELKPLEVKDEPQVSWQGDPNKYYTLVMYDPDAPNRIINFVADVKHWLVGNIKGNDISSGEVIAEYMGSGPPRFTGLHRYIFVVYEQKDKIPYENEPKSPKMSRENRLFWSVKKFSKKYDLQEAFGNFFTARWDQYVSESR